MRSVALVLAALLAASCSRTPEAGWTEEERRTIASMSLSALGEPRPDPSNAHADDPAAAAFGRALFFDTELSSTRDVSCASCHRPEAAFADGVPRSRGARGPTRRNAPSVVAAAWSPWLGWSGHADSAWAQALGPLESATEHGLTRTELAHRIAARHEASYEAVFGPLPAALDDSSRFPAAAGPRGTPEEIRAWESMSEADRAAVDAVFAAVGKALAAYERTLRPTPSRFDRYADATARGVQSSELTEHEVAGLRLFVGKGGCTTCHSGPLLTNHEFQGIGLPPGPAGLDAGRRDGVVDLLRDPFNCLGPHSDARPEQCEELRFVKASGDELLGAMRVPPLRNVARTAPYMHDGRFADLRAVLKHYDEAPKPMSGHSDLEPLGLREDELKQLEAFLKTLDSPIRDATESVEEARSGLVPSPALLAGIP